ncbi:hypothetical protein TNCV_3494661 [Trichonephila clavipes]|nr:hypothetical protein TNCV_3494661 [Trichonephila clavipes]
MFDIDSLQLFIGVAELGCNTYLMRCLGLVRGGGGRGIQRIPDSKQSLIIQNKKGGGIAAVVIEWVCWRTFLCCGNNRQFKRIELASSVTCGRDVKGN